MGDDDHYAAATNVMLCIPWMEETLFTSRFNHRLRWVFAWFQRLIDQF